MIYNLRNKKYLLPKLNKYDIIDYIDYKKINKRIHKLYYKNKQILYINSIEVRDEESVFLDIYATYKGEAEFFLFTIMSNKSNVEHEFNYNNKLYEYYKDYSYTPYYINQTFYITKDYIKDDDILKAVKYFCKNVLNSFWIWNIRLENQNNSED